MSDFLYDVFICHNSVEKGEVDTIASYLETKGIRLWYDKFELRTGTDWQGFVEKPPRTRLEIGTAHTRLPMGSRPARRSSSWRRCPPV